MRKAVIVGTGAGGATVARELQGKFDVIILESGKSFRPFKVNLSFIEHLKKTGLLFSPLEIQLLFPFMKIRKTGDNTVLVNGIGTGGTTTISAGNAIRADAEIRKLGINLDPEFDLKRYTVRFLSHSNTIDYGRRPQPDFSTFVWK